MRGKKLQEAINPRTDSMIWLRIFEALCKIYGVGQRVNRTGQEVAEETEQIYQRVKNLDG